MKPAAPPSRLMTISQAAALLAVSPATIRSAIRAGVLEIVQAPGTTSARGRRVTRASVESALKHAQREQPQ